MLLCAPITEEGLQKVKMGLFLYKLLNSVGLERGNNKKNGLDLHSAFM